MTTHTVSMHRDSQATRKRDSAVKGWNRYSWERIALGLRRYTSAWLACLKFLLAHPWFHADLTNRFARGTLALQDELDYRHSAIPTKEVWELFPDIENVDVRIGRMFPDEGSSISYREMTILCSILRHEKVRVALEIGTSIGVTAFNIALNMPEDGILYTLDLPAAAANKGPMTTYDVSISDRKMIFANREPRRFRGSSVEAKIHQLYGDSATFDYGPYAKRCDVVFVDGAHSFEYVESDTKAALRLVKPGGLILWHDYNNGFFWPDVHKYLNLFARDHIIHRIRGTMFAMTRA